MLTILVFEIKEGKNAQKLINHNLSLLIRGGTNGRRPRVWGHNPQKIFEI